MNPLIEKIISKLKGIPPLQPTAVDRIFEPQYLLSGEAHEFYKANGYVVLKNVVSTQDLNVMQSVYDEISKMDGFELQDKFLNSGRLSSSEIRQKVVSSIKEVSERILKDITITENCDTKTGGAFQIKPASGKSSLNPHQDTPIIDEISGYATYVWIPLCDTNEKNGTLCVLPGSHLWGNHQRSLNIPWIYEKYTKELWKKMVHIPLNVGDVVCFDSALIHGSLPNLSDKLRLAFTTTILPKDYQLIHYFRDEKTPENMVEVYAVDETFFTNYVITERPPAQYPMIRFEPWLKEQLIPAS